MLRIWLHQQKIACYLYAGFFCGRAPRFWLWATEFSHHDRKKLRNISRKKLKLYFVLLIRSLRIVCIVCQMQFWLGIKLNGRTFSCFGPSAQLNRCKCRFCGYFVQFTAFVYQKMCRTPGTVFRLHSINTKFSLFVVVFYELWKNSDQKPKTKDRKAARRVSSYKSFVDCVHCSSVDSRY